MGQQDIFRLLLLVLLLSNRQLENDEQIDFSELNDIIIIMLLFRLSCPQTTTTNTNIANGNTSF